jgi:TonB family protein
MVLAGALLVASSAAAQEGYKIIVNPANPTPSLTKAQVSSLFLRKTGSWEDGRPVASVDQTTAAVREAFARDILGMSGAAAFAEAQQGAASGRGEAPVSVASDREVLAFVRLKPGAIGYVSASAPLSGVKVVAVGGSERAGAQDPLPVGGAVRMPTKLADVKPIYPTIAKESRTTGIVELEVVIGTRGDVEQVRITRSVPLLDQAAVSAVRKWKFAPTVVNGQPVPVKFPVSVAFSL